MSVHKLTDGPIMPQMVAICREAHAAGRVVIDVAMQREDYLRLGKECHVNVSEVKITDETGVQSNLRVWAHEFWQQKAGEVTVDTLPIPRVCTRDGEAETGF